MSFFLESYLTAYDETLSGDSYIDPIGTLIIWSAFGRQVFQNRVNSVSNDVRNYTLSLFHHHLVRRLVADDSVRLGAALRQHYSEKQALGFKQACLILLENVFVFSVLRHGSMKGVQTGGVLGISKARRRWEETNRQPSLIFTHGQAGQVLARQLGLGVSGRYKTPLMKMGFFDRFYQYHDPRFDARWAQAAAFIRKSSSGPLARLEDEAYRFLRDHIPQLRHKGEIAFADVPQALTKAYATAFCSPAAVGAYARGFWLAQTGLDTGAAGALFQVLEADPDEVLAPRNAVEKAIHLATPAEERAKLENIARVEPFLADCALLFALMATEREQPVGHVAAAWRGSYGRGDDRLRALAAEAAPVAQLPVLKGTEAGRRFLALQNVSQAGGCEAQVRALATYHAQVMQRRGQPSWLSIDDGARIKIQARTVAAPDPQRRLPGTWQNDYYLPQFRSLVKGLKGLGS